MSVEQDIHVLSLSLLHFDKWWYSHSLPNQVDLSLEVPLRQSQVAAHKAFEVVQAYLHRGLPMVYYLY